MKIPESPEHFTIKRIMAEKLKQWFEGISIMELKMDGHEADVYVRTLSGILIHLEVIWSSSCYHEQDELAYRQEESHETDYQSQKNFLPRQLEFSVFQPLPP